MKTLGLKKKHKKKIFFSISFLLSVIIVLLVIRLFMFSSFAIYTESMHPTIKEGDILLVNKMIFGPRFLSGSGDNINIRRIKGLGSVKRNDIIVFNYPFKENSLEMCIDPDLFYVKRCIGLPGDTVFIKNGFYKVNDIDKIYGDYFNQYLLSTTSPKDFGNLCNDLETYPYDSLLFNWSICNFGPLYIPKKGYTIGLDVKNVELYKAVIEFETDQSIHICDRKIYLDSLEINSYRFKDNYYFVAGDNIFNSYDSRYWGVLPEKAIVGIATHLLKSRDPITKAFRKERFLKKLE